MTDPNVPDTDDPAMEAALRRALRSQAAKHRPAQRFNAVRSGATQAHRTQRMYGLIALAGVLVVVVSIASAIMVHRVGSSDPAAPSEQSAEPVPRASVPPSSKTTVPNDDASTAPEQKMTNAPLYWIAGTDSYHLYREFRMVPDKGDPITSAVSALLTEQPQDPDYEGVLAKAGKVEVQRDGNAIKINLSQEAFSESVLNPKQAEAAVQSIVWTATAAAKAAGAEVTITIGDESAKAWDLVEVGKTMKRDLDLRNGIWIIEPDEGERVEAGKITVQGESRSFEGTLVWAVINEGGTTVAEGVTAGGANADFAEFSFDVELTPGTYEVTVTAEDASGADNDVIDTKVIVVN